MIEWPSGDTRFAGVLRSSARRLRSLAGAAPGAVSGRLIRKRTTVQRRDRWSCSAVTRARRSRWDVSGPRGQTRHREWNMGGKCHVNNRALGDRYRRRRPKRWFQIPNLSPAPPLDPKDRSDHNDINRLRGFLWSFDCFRCVEKFYKPRCGPEHVALNRLKEYALNYWAQTVLALNLRAAVREVPT